MLKSCRILLLYFGCYGSKMEGREGEREGGRRGEGKDREGREKRNKYRI